MNARALRAASEVRGIAILRAALVPVAVISVGSADNVDTTSGYPWVVAALSVYAVVMLIVAFAGFGGERASGALATVDLAFAAALIYSTGGPRSPVQYAFYVLPIGVALRLSPGLTAAWSVLAVATYLAVALPSSRTSLPGDWDLLIGDSLALLWVSGAAVMLSALIGIRQRALAELAETRRALVQQALDAEASERRRLAEDLHDHAIQNVLLARQELHDVAHGRPGAEERLRFALDETDRQLRREVFQLHPLGLERAGLTALLESLAEHASERGGFTAAVSVAPELERMPTPELLVSCARELLTNAAKHAAAEHVTVSVTPQGDQIALVVADDGRGVPEGRLESAVKDHHIGLAALIERARAAGGDVRVRTAPGEGTEVSVLLPRER